MKKFLLESLLVMFGGGCGAITRVYTCHLLSRFNLPSSILVVNLLGCFLVGMLMALLEKRIGDFLKAFIFIGFFGAYTTLSDVSLFFNNWLLTGHLGRGVVYVLVSFSLGLLLFSTSYFFFKKRFQDQ